MGSSPSRYNACMARSRMVGIPRARRFPVLLGMDTRRSGCGWYPSRRRVLKAVDLASGVFQRPPSTPGVFAPELLTARKRARARPLNEGVSRSTRALTLFHLPSATAFTIRAWSRRTVRQTFFQSMECQSGVHSGAAPASISAADISAYLPWSVGRGSLVTEHSREVSPLSRRGDVLGGRIPPLSGRLPSGIGFLPHPSSAASSAYFAVSLPLRGGQRGYFVPLLDRPGVRSCLSAGGAPSAPGELVAPGPDHVPFLSKPARIFALPLFTALISTSPGLT